MKKNKYVVKCYKDGELVREVGFGGYTSSKRFYNVAQLTDDYDKIIWEWHKIEIYEKDRWVNTGE